MNRLRYGFLVGAVLAVGCAGSRPSPNLGGLYNKSASFHDERRNPIILIPGILGSNLIDRASGRIVWGSFTGDWANPSTPEGARLLAVDMEDDGAAHDSVVPDGVLDRLKLKVLGLPFQVKAYYQILDALGVGGYKDDSADINNIDYGSDHFTCFQFAYDWRLDNVENAARLDAFIREKRAYVQAEYEKRYAIKDYDVKFDIVAHSMGGLLTRYYLRYGAEDLPADGSTPAITWAGSRFVEQVIFVAPPNAGSLESLEYLVEGRKFGLTIPRFPAAVIGTMPSVYQTLPRSRHGVLEEGDTHAPIGDLLDPDFWVQMKWGLADPDQDEVIAWLLPDVSDLAERHRLVLDYLRRNLMRARQFMAALDTPAVPPRDLHLHLMAGDAIPTPARMAVDRKTGRLRTIENGPGDGTVLRSSALMDERVGSLWTPTLQSPIKWAQVHFLFTDHLEITRDPAFTDNILYLLLERPRN